MTLRLSILAVTGIGLCASGSASVAGPDANDYPLATIMDEHKVACSEIDMEAKVIGRAEAKGWSRLSESHVGDLHHHLKNYHSIVENAQKKSNGEFDERSIFFEKMARGRPIHLFYARLEADSRFWSMCEVWDLNVSDAPTMTGLPEIVGREPNSTKDEEGALFRIWHPGLDEEHAMLRVTYIQPQSMMAERWGSSGLFVRTEMIGELAR